MDLKLLELQITTLNEKINGLVSELLMLDLQKQAVKGKLKGNCLFPIGNNIFISGNVDGKYLYYIGKNIYIEMDPEEILEKLNEKEKILRDQIEKLKNSLINLEEQYYKELEKIKELVSKQSKGDKNV